MSERNPFGGTISFSRRARLGLPVRIALGRREADLYYALGLSHWNAARPAAALESLERDPRESSRSVRLASSEDPPARPREWNDSKGKPPFASLLHAGAPLDIIGGFEGR